MTTCSAQIYEDGPRRLSPRRPSSYVDEEERKQSSGSEGSKTGSEHDSVSSPGSCGSRGKRRKLGVYSLAGDPAQLIATAPSNMARNNTVDIVTGSNLELTNKEDSDSDNSDVFCTSPQSTQDVDTVSSSDILPQIYVTDCTQDEDSAYDPLVVSCDTNKVAIVECNDKTQLQQSALSSLISQDAYSYADGYMQQAMGYKRLMRSFSEGTETLQSVADAARRGHAAVMSLQGRITDTELLDTPGQVEDRQDVGAHVTKRASFIPVIDFEKLRKISKADQNDLEKLKDMTKQLNLNPRRPSYLKWKERHLKDKQTRLKSLAEGEDTVKPTKASSSATETDAVIAGPRRSKFKATSKGFNDSPQTDNSEGGLVPCTVNSGDLCDNNNHGDNCNADCSVRLNADSSQIKSSATGTADRYKTIDRNLEWLKAELIAMRMEDYKLAKQLVRLRKEIHHFRLERCCIENSDLLEDAIEEEEEDKELELPDFCDILPRLFNPELKHYGLTRMNIHTRRFSVF